MASGTGHGAAPVARPAWPGLIRWPIAGEHLVWLARSSCWFVGRLLRSVRWSPRWRGVRSVSRFGWRDDRCPQRCRAGQAKTSRLAAHGHLAAGVGLRDRAGCVGAERSRRSRSRGVRRHGVRSVHDAVWSTGSSGRTPARDGSASTRSSTFARSPLSAFNTVQPPWSFTASHDRATAPWLPRPLMADHRCPGRVRRAETMRDRDAVAPGPISCARLALTALATR
jgi:hypothetical protein